MEEHLDLALDLVLREMELHASNRDSYRATVNLALTLGVTVQALVATAVLSQDELPHSALLGVGFAGLLAFLVLGLRLMWLTRGALAWPDGAQLASMSATAIDLKRQLIDEMRRLMMQAEERLVGLQRRLIILIALLGGTLAWWMILLTTTTGTSPTPPK